MSEENDMTFAVRDLAPDNSPVRQVEFTANELAHLELLCDRRMEHWVSELNKEAVPARRKVTLKRIAHLDKLRDKVKNYLYPNAPGPEARVRRRIRRIEL